MVFIEFFKEKAAVGFYISAVVAVLCLLTALVHPVAFAAIGPEFTAWESVILLLAGFGHAAVCIVLPIFVRPLREWMLPIAPWILAGAALLALLLFVPQAYAYINANATGTFELKSEFILTAVFFILTPIIATAGIFIRLVKKENKKEEA